MCPAGGRTSEFRYAIIFDCHGEDHSPVERSPPSRPLRGRRGRRQARGPRRRARLAAQDATARRAAMTPRRRPHGHRRRLRARGFRRGATRRPRGQRLSPHRDPARLRRGHDDAPGQRARRARVGAGRRRQGDRGRAGRQVRRPGPTTAASPGPTLRAREGERLRIRFVNGTHHPHTIHFHGIHPAAGRRARPRAPGSIQPGGTTVYEFDAEPVRPAPLPLPRRAAGRPHRQGPLRRLHHRPQAGPPRGRRDGDGDERVRHELRPLQRGLRGQQHRRSPTWTSRSRSRATSSSASTSPTCSSSTSSTRSTSTATSSTTSRPARRCSPASSPTPSCSARASAASSRCASRSPGKFMFHAHQSEFTELGWMGFFEAGDDASGALVGGLPEDARTEAQLMPARPAPRRCRRGLLGLLPLLLIAVGDRELRGARRPGLGDRTGPAGRGADGRAHGPAARRDRAERPQRRPRPGDARPGRRSTTPTSTSAAPRPRSAAWGARTVHDRLPVDRGRGLRGPAAHLDRRDDHARDRRRRSRPRRPTPAFFGLMALLGPLRRRHPRRPRHAVAALGAPHLGAARCAS